MTNRIRHVTLRDRCAIPTEAELFVTVTPEILDGTTEVRGRILGPSCQFATTIEVAYPLRPHPVPAKPASVTLRAVIPEASLWEPESPHLYTAVVELWHNGQRADAARVRHVLRHVTLGPRGLRVNGRLLRLRGRIVELLTEDDALALRKQGYTLLVAPPGDGAQSICEVADRVGFFVLYRGQDGSLVSANWILADTMPGDFQLLPASRLPGYAADKPVVVLAAPGEAIPTPPGESVVIGVVELV